MRRELSRLFMILLASNVFSTANAATTKVHKSASHKKTHHAKPHKSGKKKRSNKGYMEGIASFYGENDGFQGRKMANGKRFNTFDVYSAAHPILPLGTKLMVTNMANGRTIYVEVRDRMPRGSRVIDLSVAAANYLGMHHKGLTRVQLVKITDQEFEQNKRYLEVEDGDNGAPS